MCLKCRFVSLAGSIHSSISLQYRLLFCHPIPCFGPVFADKLRGGHPEFSADYPCRMNWFGRWISHFRFLQLEGSNELIDSIRQRESFHSRGSDPQKNTCESGSPTRTRPPNDAINRHRRHQYKTGERDGDGEDQRDDGNRMANHILKPTSFTIVANRKTEYDCEK